MWDLAVVLELLPNHLITKRQATHYMLMLKSALTTFFFLKNAKLVQEEKSKNGLKGYLNTPIVSLTLKRS